MIGSLHAIDQRTPSNSYPPGVGLHPRMAGDEPDLHWEPQTNRCPRRPGPPDSRIGPGRHVLSDTVHLQRRPCGPCRNPQPQLHRPVRRVVHHQIHVAVPRIAGRNPQADRTAVRQRRLHPTRQVLVHPQSVGRHPVDIARQAQQQTRDVGRAAGRVVPRLALVTAHRLLRTAAVHSPLIVGRRLRVGCQGIGVEIGRPVRRNAHQRAVVERGFQPVRVPGGARGGQQPGVPENPAHRRAGFGVGTVVGKFVVGPKRLPLVPRSQAAGHVGAAFVGAFPQPDRGLQQVHFARVHRRVRHGRRQVGQAHGVPVGVALPANRRVILLVVKSAQIRRVRAPLVQEEHGLPQIRRISRLARQFHQRQFNPRMTVWL